MELTNMQEYHSEFLEGYYFIPSDLEKSSPGWFVRAGLSQAKPNYHLGPKLSPYHYLIFILEGKGCLVQGQKTYQLRENDLFCLFPHITQEYYTIKEAPMLSVWIALDGSYISQLLAGAGLRPQTPYRQSVVTPALMDWIQAFFEWYRNPDTQDSDLARMSKFYRLFDLLTPKQAPEAFVEGPSGTWLRQAVEYMQIHYTEGITAEKVAAYLGVERTLFSKKFSAYFGMTPGKYLKSLKMEDAKRLLVETDYGIAEIAQMVSYADLYSFSKEFKKSTGFPPSHYRPKSNSSTDPPVSFSRQITNLHGKQGEQWLQSFPKLISYCENKWSLRTKRPYRFCTNCLVPSILKDGREAVLKLGVPCRDMYTEIESFRLLDHAGMVRLIDAEPNRGMLLLEKAVPGQSLDTLEDEAAAKITAGVIRALHAAPPPVKATDFAFERTADWPEELRLFESNCGGSPLSPAMARQARRLLDRLHTVSGPAHLLHGNLHPGHILSVQGGKWAGISSKGIWAPLEYEGVAFLLHRLPQVQIMETIRRRAGLLAREMGWHQENLLAWCFCHAVHEGSQHIEMLMDRQSGMQPLLQAMGKEFAAIEKKTEFTKRG